MPRKRRELRQDDVAARLIFLLLRLGAAPPEGLAAAELRGTDGEPLFAVYPREPNKAIDRDIKLLQRAGYDVSRYSRPDRDGRDRTFLRLEVQPFVPIQVTSEQLPHIQRLVATYLAAGALTVGGIPHDVLLARQARHERRTLIATASTTSFPLIPLMERLLTNGRWAIVGRIPSSGAVFSPRVGGRYSFALGEPFDDGVDPSLQVEDNGSSLSWGAGPTFEVSFDVPDAAIGSVLAHFRSAVRQQIDIGHGMERFIVTGRNRRELCKLLTLLRGNVHNISPARAATDYERFLARLSAVSPIAAGYESGPAFLTGEPGIPELPDPGADQLIPADDAVSSPTSAQLVGRLLLILRHLDIHGQAPINILGDLVKLFPEQTVVLIDCYRSAHLSALDSDAIWFLDADGQRVSAEGPVATVVKSTRNVLLKETGRYYATQAQMLTAAAVALIELESADVSDSERDLLSTLVEKAEATFDIDVDLPPEGPGPSLTTLDLMGKNCNHMVNLTYTNPWTVSTTRREIVPIAKPRMLLGRWLVEALDLTPSTKGTPATRDRVKHFYLDFATDVTATGRPAAVPFTAAELDRLKADDGTQNAVLRAPNGPVLDWLRASWSARAIKQSGHETDGEVSVAVDVYPPVSQRLLDLFILTEGEVRVDLPHGLRTYAHDNIAGIQSGDAV